VHAAAFMALRGVWQRLRRFESKILRQPRAHDAHNITFAQRLSSRANEPRNGDRKL